MKRFVVVTGGLVAMVWACSAPTPPLAGGGSAQTGTGEKQQPSAPTSATASAPAAVTTPPSVSGDAGAQKKSPVGGTCKTSADCVSGLDICNEDPGGQCTKDCKVDADCAAFPGAVCEPGGGHCYQKCTSNSDCTRAGYACVGGDGDHKFCDPKHIAGESCTSAADCADGLNICNEDPGGQCTKDCNSQADCDGAEGAVCETNRPGHCYHECKTKADCPRDGYDCVGGPNAEGKMWCDVVN